MRARPEAAAWNPSSVLMSVDLPAPFGPSRPMGRAWSEPCRESRMVRPPSRTTRFSSSMTGGNCLTNLRVPPARGSRNSAFQQHRQRQVGRVEVEEAADARDLDAVALAVHAQERGLRVARERLERGSLLVAELRG